MKEVKKNVSYRSIIQKHCPSCKCPIPKTDIENCNTCGVPFEDDSPQETEVETDEKQ